MPVTYAHGRTHATVAFSGALDRAGAGEQVDVVDLLVMRAAVGADRDELYRAFLLGGLRQNLDSVSVQPVGRA